MIIWLPLLQIVLEMTADGHYCPMNKIYTVHKYLTIFSKTIMENEYLSFDCFLYLFIFIIHKNVVYIDPYCAHSKEKKKWTATQPYFIIFPENLQEMRRWGL